jgi:hypothetical protein
MLLDEGKETRTLVVESILRERRSILSSRQLRIEEKLPSKRVGVRLEANGQKIHLEIVGQCRSNEEPKSAQQ